MSHKHKSQGEQGAGDHVILDAAMRVAALSGWRHLSFSAVAEEAGVPLSTVLRHYPTRASLVRALGRVVDRAMLTDDLTIDPRETVRDRLFDLLMRRFDALEPYREAIRALLPTFGRDLSLFVAFSGSLDRSMAVTLEAAGIDVVGTRGALQLKGLEGVYVYAMRAWLKDDTPDKAQTMAALDKTLDRIDSVASTVFGRGCGPLRRETARETMQEDLV